MYCMTPPPHSRQVIFLTNRISTFLLFPDSMTVICLKVKIIIKKCIEEKKKLCVSVEWEELLVVLSPVTAVTPGFPANAPDKCCSKTALWVLGNQEWTPDTDSRKTNLLFHQGKERLTPGCQVASSRRLQHIDFLLYRHSLELRKTSKSLLASDICGFSVICLIYHLLSCRHVHWPNISLFSFHLFLRFSGH